MKQLRWLFFILCDSTILLYDTNNYDETQAYDCIYYDGDGVLFVNNMESIQSIKYCIRPIEFVSIERNYSLGCLNGGILLSFDVLKEYNMTAQELLRWNSGVNVIDQYHAYLDNSRFYRETEQLFICNCTNNRTFGVLCEYQFSQSSFEETVLSQYGKKLRYPLGSQLFGRTTCYQTSFPCDYGKVCLDWRHICDGNQQCVDGTDEEYCEVLLLNECNQETEYRCRNGMCIDEEYFLDGDIDCQDQSDEQSHLIYSVTTLCFARFKLDCDERMLESKQHVSCGDGSYIHIQQLFRQPSGATAIATCHSFRDRQWKCELRDGDIMWTNPENGHCLDYVDNTTNVIEEEIDCIFIHKCALTKQGQHHLCPCTGNGCRAYFFRYCNSNNISLFAYPPGRIFTPFVETFYKSDIHDFDRNPWPDVFIFTRSIKCYNIENPTDWLYNESIILRTVKEYSIHPLEILFCERYVSMNNGTCWTDSYPDQARSCQGSMSHECISKYNVKDGISDCTRSEDEKMEHWHEDCSSIRKHRFQCSHIEQTCLTILAIGDNRADCKKSNRDEYSAEYNLELRNLKCTSRDSSDCIFLRQYIAELSNVDANITETTDGSIKFWNYCDSSWEKSYGTDEMNCHEWKCPMHYTAQQYYRCQTGQCISHKWLCNGEWDCADGSDEEGIQLLTEYTINEHNSKLFRSLRTSLTEMKSQCSKANSERALKQLCDIKTEYPCLLANVDDPWNFQLNRPCIHLTQLGDGHADCFGGLDERNIFNCSSYQQLGFGFKCDIDEKCIARRQQCTDRHRCSNGNDRFLCIYLSNNSYIQCNGQRSNATVADTHCLNGTCLPNSRCNGIAECPFGEDEYYCPTGRSTKSSVYREAIVKSVVSPIKIQLPNYVQSSFSETNSNPSKASSRQALANRYAEDGWTCNRGVRAAHRAFRVNKLSVKCFCPPSYYGDRCEFMSDRLTIFITFENQMNNTFEGVIQILAQLVVNINHTETIVDHHEVHILNNFKEKQKFYFVYPRPHQLRSNIHSYTVRFQAYQLYENDTIQFLATWIYPVPFHFLPSQRLAKVLKFQSNHTCSLSTNPCLNGGKCHPIMNMLNDTHSYWCQCQNNSYGSHCQFRDQSCLNYCSRTSLCRPKSDHYGQKPLCLCSMNSYGQRCFISRPCQMKIGRNPCQNGGKCITKYQYDKLTDGYTCQCPKYYYGSECQYRSGSIKIISVDTFEDDEIRATIIQLFDISDREELILRRQILYKDNLPSPSLTIPSENINLPLFGLIKLYTNRSTIVEYHLLYTNSTKETSLNLTLQLTKKNYCPHTHDIFNLRDGQRPIVNVVGKYHTLCDKTSLNNSSLLCFVDDDYFCLCDANDIAQCFSNYRKFDQCNLCLVGGQCIKGEIDTPSDYLCLCPPCYFGSTCQHNTKLFSYTLDTLISSDLVSPSLSKQRLFLSIYIIVPTVLFIYGIISNLFSFVTFRRARTRQNGTGYYLYTSAIFSQLSLFCLLTKTVHIIINIRGFSIDSIVNIVLCKLLSFLLSSSTRISYWLIIFVAIERMYLVLFAVKRWLNQPKIAKRIILFIIILTCASHVHELIKYVIIDDPKYTVNGKWCVTQFNYPLQVYNQVNTMIHYLASFLVNFICTIILLTTIVRSRAKLDRNKTRWQIFKKEFQRKKEMFIPLLTIITSALPHLVISFSLGCSDLDRKWQRYLLILSYFSAYLPQSLTFHIYVQPSKLFLQEFHETKVWKTLRQR